MQTNQEERYGLSSLLVTGSLCFLVECFFYMGKESSLTISSCLLLLIYMFNLGEVLTRHIDTGSAPEIRHL